MNFKTYFLASTLLILGTAQAKLSNEMLKDPNGNSVVFSVSGFSATGINPLTNKKENPDICEALGQGRLPTAREYALDSVARGAKGILEFAEVDSTNVPKGYREISAIDPDGKYDVFYFNGEGYQGLDKIGHRLFWTSSQYRGNAFYFYGFYNTEGFFDAHYGLAPVRCFTEER